MATDSDSPHKSLLTACIRLHGLRVRFRQASEEVSKVLQAESDASGTALGRTLCDLVNEAKEEDKLSTCLTFFKEELPYKIFKEHGCGDSTVHVDWTWVDRTSPSKAYLKSPENWAKFLHAWRNQNKLSVNVPYGTRGPNGQYNIPQQGEGRTTANVIKALRSSKIALSFTLPEALTQFWAVNLTVDEYTTIVEKLEAKQKQVLEGTASKFTKVYSAMRDLHGELNDRKLAAVAKRDSLQAEVAATVAEIEEMKQTMQLPEDVDISSMLFTSDSHSESGYSMLSDVQ